MTIPSWLILITWLFISGLEFVFPNPLETSEKYNWQLVDLGENADKITINRLMIYEFIEGGDRFFDNAFFPEQEKLIYDLNNKEQIKLFFKAMANHQKPVSMCYPREGNNYFRLRALDHTNMKEATLTFHLCKFEGQDFAIIEVDDSSIHTDYFASAELAKFLCEIGITP